MPGSPPSLLVAQRGRRASRAGIRAVQTCFVFTAGVLMLFEGCCTADAQQLKCDTGPLQKTYASTQWLVYSCQDARSLVFVTPQGNPAMPFYFFLHPSDGGYLLEGEGTGNKDITDRVVAELQRLSGADITALINETRAVAPAKTQ